jgi:hypothetical protein
MKRTHKLRGLANVAGIIAAAPSIQAAARQLGVDRSTVHRWIASGKAPRPSVRLRPSLSGGAGPRQSPEAWARVVRRAYALSATESALLDLAVRALAMARDDSAKAETRLAAMGRYQQLVRQLNLESEDRGETETEAQAQVRPWPRRVG